MKEISDMSRNIDEVLLFREDISPFLVHLTRDTIYDDQPKNAKENLINILKNMVLDPGDFISQASYGVEYHEFKNMPFEDKQKYFSSICFTETPINEIHCMLEIESRSKNLSEYGLVFLKDNLTKRMLVQLYT